MTRDQVVDAIMRRLANRTDTQDTLRNYIIQEILSAITNVLEMNEVLPWFLLQQINGATTATQEYMALDSNHLAFWEDAGGFWRQNSDGSETQLVIDDWDVVKAYAYQVDGSDNDAPKYGSVIVNNLYMRPIPDAVYTIKYWQYGKVDVSTIDGVYGDANGGNTNDWLTEAAEWVTGEAGAIVAAEIVRDQAGAQNFVAQAQRGKTLTMAKSIRKEEELKTRIFGEI